VEAKGERNKLSDERIGGLPEFAVELSKGSELILDVVLGDVGVVFGPFNIVGQVLQNNNRAAAFRVNVRVPCIQASDAAKCIESSTYRLRVLRSQRLVGCDCRN
jgi:hypothetical protein